MRSGKRGAEVPDRRANLEGVLASFAMEGLEPDKETSVVLEDYASGRITLEEAGARIEAHVASIGEKDTLSGAA